MVKNLPASAGDVREVGSVLRSEDPLKEERAAHSSILARRIPWTEEPGGLQSMGLQRIGHDCLSRKCHLLQEVFLKE